MRAIIQSISLLSLWICTIFRAPLSPHWSSCKFLKENNGKFLNIWRQKNSDNNDCDRMEANQRTFRQSNGRYAPYLRYPRAAHQKWCFTLFYYTQEEYDVITGFIASACLYGVVGQEHSTNGHPHLQGYLWLARARTFFNLKRLFFGRVHLEVAVQSASRNRDYCIKKGLFWEHNRLDSDGFPLLPHRNYNLASVPQRIQQPAQAATMSSPQHQEEPPEVPPEKPQPPATTDQATNTVITGLPAPEEPPMRDGCQCVWLWGPTGVGKSQYARDKYPNAYWKAPHIYWGQYNRQTDAIIDAIGLMQRPHCEEIVRWLDKFPCLAQTKGGETPLYVTNFIITSAYPPEEVFADAVDPSAIMRRMKVFRVDSRSDFERVDEHYETLKRDSLHFYAVDINRCPSSPTATVE